MWRAIGVVPCWVGMVLARHEVMAGEVVFEDGHHLPVISRLVPISALQLRAETMVDSLRMAGGNVGWGRWVLPPQEKWACTTGNLTYRG